MGRVILLAIILLAANSVFAIEHGSIEYKANEKLDCSKFDISLLEQDATYYYNLAASSPNAEEVKNALIKALGAYKLLNKSYPDNINYCVKIAEIYSKINKDRMAKEYYYRAITLSGNSALPYESFGDYYYTRNNFINNNIIFFIMSTLINK